MKEKILFQEAPSPSLLGIIIVAVLVREGYEALNKEKLCSCCNIPCESEPRTEP